MDAMGPSPVIHPSASSRATRLPAITQRRKTFLLPVIVVSFVAVVSIDLTAFTSAASNPRHTPPIASTRTVMEVTRRDAANLQLAAPIAAGIATAFGAQAPAPVMAKLIEDVYNTPDPRADMPQREVITPGATAAKLQKVIIFAGDTAELEAELKFWNKVCAMDVLDDSMQDGQRAVTVGFKTDSGSNGGAFGVQIKVDPALLTRARPKLLDWNAIQPTVDTLNFMQVTSTEKVTKLFELTQANGATAMIGDLTFLDVESPRGVAVRFISDPDKVATVDLVSLNVDVAFYGPTVSFYQRAFGLKEIDYPLDGADIQPFSAYLKSDAGGPNLLISPVPRGRLKDPKLDVFEGASFTSSNSAAIKEQAEKAIAIAYNEELQAEADRKRDKTAEQIAEMKIVPTAVPVVTTAANGLPVIDDGVGSLIFVSDFSFSSSAGKEIAAPPASAAVPAAAAPAAEAPAPAAAAAAA